MYEPRTYRSLVEPPGLVSFRVVDGETDLLIHARRELSDTAAEQVAVLRADLSTYIAAHPRFAESFVPVPVDAGAPAIVRDMALAAGAAKVGPMAAVAGAFAEAVARSLAERSDQVIVENGGDVYLIGEHERTVAVWSGDATPLVGVRLRASSMPCAVATSSGTIGPSVSLGRADAATVVAAHGALADAAASVVGNRIHEAADLDAAIAAGRAVAGVIGVVAVVDGHLAAWGDIELTGI